MKKKVISILLFVVVAITTVGYAAPALKQINVNFDVFKKILVDGVDRTPKDKKAFVYNGTVYLPSNYINEALGKDVKWDGKSGTLYVGNMPGEIVYLTDIKPYNISDFCNELFNDKYYKIDENMIIANKKYNKGLQLRPDGYETQKVFYNLDGCYKNINGIVGLDDNDNSFVFEEPVKIKFFIDDKLIKTLEFNKGDLSKKIDLDVTGGLKLTIEVSCEYNNHPWIDFVDMKIK